MIHDSPNGQTHVLTGEIVSSISSCCMVQSLFLTRWWKRRLSFRKEPRVDLLPQVKTADGQRGKKFHCTFRPPLFTTNNNERATQDTKPRAKIEMAEIRTGGQFNYSFKQTLATFGMFRLQIFTDALKVETIIYCPQFQHLLIALSSLHYQKRGTRC